MLDWLARTFRKLVEAPGRLFGRPPEGALASAAWLNDDLLLVICDLGTSKEVRARMMLSDGEAEARVFAQRYRRHEIGGRSHITMLAVVELPEGARAEGLTEVVLRSGAARLALGPSELQGSPRQVDDGIGAHLSPLEPAARRALHELVLEVCAPHLDGSDAGTLAANMQRLREILRERGRERVSTPDEPLNHDVDRIMAVDDRAFWVRGWIRDEKQAATELIAVSPEGYTAELMRDAFRYQRPDIEAAYGSAGMEAAEKHGLMSCFELPAPSRLSTGWLTKLETPGGGGSEGVTPEVIRDFAAVRELILRDTKEDDFEYRLTKDHAYPALSRLQERLRRSVEVDTVIDYGPQPRAPEVSIVVPFYERIDFLQHQLVQFVHDGEIGAVDLLYVLDSPELARELNKVAAELHEFYGLPFRVAILSRNGGFALANDLGASIARGRTLAFVNSDVLPAGPGWVSRMAAFYDATPNIGALGAKLLYEDHSLQHAGMYFQLEAATSLWGNQHYLKGLSRSFAPANVARPVPAVTGACMMIDRALFEEVGGFDHSYVQGGYEDSDLCLRLVRLGRQNWYLPSVELFHLEEQSYPTSSEYRWLATRYNAWLQTHRWRALIEELMSTPAQGQAPAPSATVAA